MFSVKPGRGPSFIGGLIGIVFTVMALVMAGAALSVAALSVPIPAFIPIGFAAICGIFAVVGIAVTVQSFYNTSQPNRLSSFDVTASNEEPDPIAGTLGYTQTTEPPQEGRQIEGNYCPQCGASVQSDYNFCPQCGKDI